MKPGFDEFVTTGGRIWQVGDIWFGVLEYVADRPPFTRWYAYAALDEKGCAMIAGTRDYASEHDALEALGFALATKQTEVRVKIDELRARHSQLDNARTALAKGPRTDGT